MTPGAAVIFDFDGVLADTERLHLRAFQDVLGAHSLALGETEYFERYLGFDDRGLVLALARDRGVGLDDRSVHILLEAKARRFAAHVAGGDALYPAAKACVRRLGAQYPLAIASGALHEEIVAILDTAGLTPAFATIVGADDVAVSKPAPDPYLEAARRLGVDPRRAVAIEDSRWGLESARAAGLRTIGITTSYPAASLAPTDAIVVSLDEVTDALIAGLLARPDNR